MTRTWVFWSTIAMMIVGALEAFTFAGVKLIEYRHPRFFRQEFITHHFDALTDEDLRQFKRTGYDPLLGWTFRPDTILRYSNHAGRIIATSFDSDGARRDGLAAKPDLMDAYGDSFTECAEVSDDETWQFYLGKQLGYKINNFGVGGYGTDQALLKFEKHVAHNRKSPIAILGIYEENINRIINQFRPFYIPWETGFMFKPSFQTREGQLVLNTNPLIPEITSVAGAEKVARQLIGSDYWAKPNLQNRFPYILQIPSLLELVWDKLETLRVVYPVWQNDRPVELMRGIVDRFVRVATARGVQPIVLFIPAVSWWQSGRREPGYENLKQELRHRHPKVPVIDVAEHEFSEKRFNILPFTGHVSAYGNRQIARILAQELRSNGFDSARLARLARRVQ